MKFRIVTLSLFILIGILAFFSCSEDNKVTSPTSGENMAEALQEVLDEGRQQLSHLGVSAAVMTADDEIWTGVSGYSDPESNIRIDENMVFGIASITKTFTAAVILQLAEEQKLLLDDSLGKWLPAYPNIDGGITIRQLLNMTGGIYDYVENDAYDEAVAANLNHYWSPEDMLNYVEGPISNAETGGDIPTPTTCYWE